MPELPEVETIVRQLRSKVKGKTIVSAEIFDMGVVDPNIKAILPVKILDVLRRGKSIIFYLNDGKFILTHLRMTGHFYYVNILPNEEYRKFMVGKFDFSDGTFLTHNSIRKFGSMRLVDKDRLKQELDKLGVEPLGAGFTLNRFNEILGKKARSNIKTVLLDQSQIAGIGNIYAQEALYFAGINPCRKAGEIQFEEVKKLHLEVVRILTAAVKQKGSTVDNYSNIDGAGNYQKYLVVYNKQFCPKKHPLEKINLGGRGTSFCSVCQR